MKRFFLSAVLALLVAFSLSAAPAEAGTITLKSANFSKTGNGDTTFFEQIDQGKFTVSHDFGSYNSKFKDTFQIAVVGLTTALNFDITTWGHVIGMNFNLYDSTGKGIPLQSLVITNSGGTQTQRLTITGALLAQIVAQSYVVLKITGVFCACAGYSITATPVPPALIMFLTALGGLGFFAKRRKLAGAMGAAA